MADLCFIDTKTHALLLTSFREGVYWLERHLNNATRPRLWRPRSGPSGALHAFDLEYFPLTNKLQTSASNAQLIQALKEDVVSMNTHVKLLADDGLAAYEAFLSLPGSLMRRRCGASGFRETMTSKTYGRRSSCWMCAMMWRISRSWRPPLVLPFDYWLWISLFISDDGGTETAKPLSVPVGGVVHLDKGGIPILVARLLCIQNLFKSHVCDHHRALVERAHILIKISFACGPSTKEWKINLIGAFSSWYRGVKEEILEASIGFVFCDGSEAHAQRKGLCELFLLFGKYRLCHQAPPHYYGQQQRILLLFFFGPQAS